MLDPEKVEDRTEAPLTVPRPVEGQDFASGGGGQGVEVRLDFVSIDRTQGEADGPVGDGIDVPADGRGAEFVRFPHGRSATHEGIEDDEARKAYGLVEEVADRGAPGSRRGDDGGAKDGPQPPRPPLVDMVRRAVHLLPPTLHLRDLAEPLEWETLFDGPRAPVREKGGSVRGPGFGDGHLRQGVEGGRGPRRLARNDLPQAIRHPAREEQQGIRVLVQGAGQLREQALRRRDAVAFDPGQVRDIHPHAEGEGAERQSEFLSAGSKEGADGHSRSSGDSARC